MKKALSILLALVLCLCCCAALAEGENGVLVFGSLYLASAVRPVMLAKTEKNNAAPTV